MRITNKSPHTRRSILCPTPIAPQHCLHRHQQFHHKRQAAYLKIRGVLQTLCGGRGKCTERVVPIRHRDVDDMDDVGVEAQCQPGADLLQQQVSGGVGAPRCCRPVGRRQGMHREGQRLSKRARGGPLGLYAGLHGTASANPAPQMTAFRGSDPMMRGDPPTEAGRPGPQPATAAVRGCWSPPKATARNHAKEKDWLSKAQADLRCVRSVEKNSMRTRCAGGGKVKPPPPPPHLLTADGGRSECPLCDTPSGRLVRVPPRHPQAAPKKAKCPKMLTSPVDDAC